MLHCGEFQSKADLCGEVFSLKRKPSLPNHLLGEARDHVDFCSRSSRTEVSSRRSGSKATLKSATATFAPPPTLFSNICRKIPSPSIFYPNTLFSQGNGWIPRESPEKLQLVGVDWKSCMNDQLFRYKTHIELHPRSLCSVCLPVFIYN